MSASPAQGQTVNGMRVVKVAASGESTSHVGNVNVQSVTTKQVAVAQAPTAGGKSSAPQIHVVSNTTSSFAGPGRSSAFGADTSGRVTTGSRNAGASFTPSHSPNVPSPHWSGHDDWRWHHHWGGWWDPFWSPVFWYPPPVYYYSYAPGYYPWGAAYYYPAYSPLWYDEFAWHPRHGWSLSFSFGYASPVYCTSWTTMSYGYATRTIAVDPYPQYDWLALADESCAPHTTTIYRVPASSIFASSSVPNVVNVPVQAFQPTLYQSDSLAGVMSWTDTPSTIVRTLQQQSVANRSDLAANYLGKVPAGGWDVGFEQEKVVAGVHELWFRGLEMDNLGRRPLVIVHPQGGDVPHLYAGQRMTVTGRLSGVCVDDPMEPQGKLILDDGSVKN